MRKTFVFFFLTFLLFTVVAVVAAKPASGFSLKIGPYWNRNLSVRVEGRFALRFWVARVKSTFSFDAVATNNSVSILPASSLTYVEFNWKHLLLEYGANGYHSTNFVTPWDVGTVPRGWKVSVRALQGDNFLAFGYDRGGYDARFRNNLLLVDAWWYSTNVWLTAGIFNFFVCGGRIKKTNSLGFGGKIGGWDFSLFFTERAVNVFSNVANQIPSKYVGIFRYNSNGFNLILAMTENEFYIDSYSVFHLFHSLERVWIKSEYLDVYPYELKMNGGLDFEKEISANSNFFVNFSYDKTPILWSGMIWRF